MKLDLRYIAGFFDGEGNVEITNKFALRIGFCNTNLKILKSIQWQLGGSISQSKYKTEKPNWKIGYILRLSGTQARSALKKLLPHLVLKKPQASLGLKVVPHVRGVKITETEQVQRNIWRHQIQELNRRGPRRGEPGQSWGELK